MPEDFDTDAHSFKRVMTNAFTKAIDAQLPAAKATVARLRRVHKDKSPEELIRYINKLYLATVTTSGAGAGAAAVVPNGAVQAPMTIADLASFIEASVMYVLTIAEIYKIDVEDVERRKFLIMIALLGDSGAKEVIKAFGKKTVPYWSKTVINKLPIEMINKANKILGPRFITKYGTKQGVLVLGKQLPLMLGAGIGAGGNALFGYFVINSTKKLLQDPPENWEDS